MSLTPVGREPELERLATCLAADGPAVTFLHGIAGHGKSTLLQALRERATGQGMDVVLLDGRQVEPTPRGLLDAWGDAAGPAWADAAAVKDAAAQSTGPMVLALDNVESLLLLDAWLRQDLMRGAPPALRLVLAGRMPPLIRWTTDPALTGRFVALELGPLAPDAAACLLAGLGVPEHLRPPIIARTHGNPLALRLAAGAVLARPGLDLEDGALPEVMRQLTEIHLAEVEDPGTRQALRCSSVARRITRSLLRALPGTEDAHFDALRALPFASERRDGLGLHEAVRDAIAATLRAQDPVTWIRCRRQAWRQLRQEIGSAPRAELWRYTADLLHLIENPVVREAFFPSGAPALAVESATTADRAEILSLAEAHDGPAGARITAAWWEHCPSAFRVARSAATAVHAFSILAESQDVPPELVAADPMTAAWLDHMDADPGLPDTAGVLFLRRWLTRDVGDAPADGQGALWLDAKRVYMELRPDLARVYLAVADLAPYAAAAARLGIVPLVLPAGLGSGLAAALLDFGPGSVDGWLTRLVQDELGAAAPDPLDRERRALVVGGRDVALTPREYGLAVFLVDRPGVTASRDEILAAAWGADAAATGSNVVDATVKALRRKLGPDAALLETVRGFGYRWKAD